MAVLSLPRRGYEAVETPAATATSMAKTIRVFSSSTLWHAFQ